MRTASRETGGPFTARDPEGRVDPTGLVKGWAVARVGHLLLDAGCRTGASPRPATSWCTGRPGRTSRGSSASRRRMRRASSSTPCG